MQRPSQWFKTRDNGFPQGVLQGLVATAWRPTTFVVCFVQIKDGFKGSHLMLKCSGHLTRHRTHSNQQGELSGGDKQHTAYQRNNMPFISLHMPIISLWQLFGIQTGVQKSSCSQSGNWAFPLSSHNCRAYLSCCDKTACDMMFFHIGTITGLFSSDFESCFAQKVQHTHRNTRS